MAVKKKAKVEKESKPEKPVNINSLKDVPGIGPTGQDRLAERGITNMLSLWAGCNNPTKLVQITGMEKTKAVDALAFVRRELEKAEVIGAREQTADKTHEDLLRRKHLHTGCNSIDTILRGGFEQGVLYEVFGHEGAGKTQLLHKLAIMAQLPVEDGGLYEGETYLFCVNCQLPFDEEIDKCSECNGKLEVRKKIPNVLFIDTENTLRPERFEGILEGLKLISQMPAEIQKKLDEQKPFTLEESKKFREMKMKQLNESREYKSRILHWKSSTAASLFVNLENANSMISTGFPIKLVIIDSLTNVFRGNYIGRGTNWSKSDDSRDIMKMIKDLTEVHKIVVVFVTQVYEKTDRAGPWEPKYIAYGGHIVGHAPQIRLQLDIPSGNPTAEKRRMTIVKAPHLPNDQALYKVTSKGLEDIE